MPLEPALINPQVMVYMRSMEVFDMQMDVVEAKVKLSALIAAAEKGDKVYINRNGKPSVMLVPVAKKKLVFGSIPELKNLDLDFDTPMSEEELALWEGKL